MASAQLCSHIWQGQPSPGSQQMLQAQAAPVSRAWLCCRAQGHGLGLSPLSAVSSPVLLAAAGPRSGSKHLPLATEQVRELAAPTAEPGLLPNHPAPALEPKPPGLCQMGGGKEAAAPAKPPPGTLSPRCPAWGTAQSCPSHSPSQGWVCALRALLSAHDGTSSPEVPPPAPPWHRRAMGRAGSSTYGPGLHLNEKPQP